MLGLSYELSSVDNIDATWQRIDIGGRHQPAVERVDAADGVGNGHGSDAGDRYYFN